VLGEDGLIEHQRIVKGLIDRYYQKVFLYRYLRFGSNGIAFYSNQVKDPFTGLNIYDTGGEFCYYRIEGNELRIQLYDDQRG